VDVFVQFLRCATDRYVSANLRGFIACFLARLRHIQRQLAAVQDSEVQFVHKSSLLNAGHLRVTLLIWQSECHEAKVKSGAKEARNWPLRKDIS
jgi:hypothetical protein